MIAADLAETVEEMGYEVQGPAHEVASALDLLASVRVDGALLDVNLGGETSYPVADALASRDIPFVFLSGYANTQLRTGFETCRLLSKPIQQDALCAGLHDMLRED